MFKRITKLAIATMFAAPLGAYAQNPSLEERIAELEANQSLNIFNFSGTFITRYDNLSLDQTTPSTIDNKDLGYLRMRFSLNADANVSKYVKFYSRFTTTKFFNTWRTQGTASTSGADLRASDTYSSSGVFLEKAYADMMIPDTNFILSLGRLPTPDGQPGNYWDGRARLGTYPLLAYSSVLDGAALTYKVDEYLPQGNKLSLRMIYTPFSEVFVGTGAYTTPPTHDSNPTTGAQTGNKTHTLKDFYTGQIDYSNSNLGFAENFGLIVQHNSLSPLNVSGTGSSTLRFGLKATSVAAELNGVASLPMDISVSHLMSEIHSQGLMSGLGYGTTTSDAKTSGSMTLVSLRYRFSSWLVGAEVGNGTKGVFYSGGTAEDLTNMYGTPGDLYHGYFTKKFTETLSLRVGYYQQKEKTTRIGLGAISDSDRKIDVGYMNFRADF